MSDTNNDCGCCAGIDAETPKRVENRPGLPDIAYRVGTHHDFKESMQARLSPTEYPALARFTARDDADFAIALCDAAAVMFDVLSFYQERIATENFLRTAEQRRSILELSRLIGYQLAPGVAASTWLAFILQGQAGERGGVAEPVTIPIGTRVQSVPGPDEQAQSFETVAPVEARLEWCDMAAQTRIAWRPQMGDTELYLAGVATGLQTGDIILIVGQERENDPGSENWDIRVLTAVEADLARERTRIAWIEGLGHTSPFVTPAAEAPKVFVFRQRASLFGFNAPDPRLMSTSATSKLADMIEDVGGIRVWKNYKINGATLDLDAAYPKVVAGSWFALVSNESKQGLRSLPGYIELYRVQSVAVVARTDYGLSGKITHLTPDGTENLSASRYGIRNTLVLAQSEPLETASRPLLFPLYGATVSLGSVQRDLTPGRTLAVFGKRQRIVMGDKVKNLVLTLDNGKLVALSPGDSLRLEQAPERVIGGTVVALSPTMFRDALDGNVALRLRVRDRDENLGTLTVQSQNIRLQPSDKKDATISEIVRVDSADNAVVHTRDVTTLALEAPLNFVYERESVRINANVAPATHGESVSETVGSGNAAVPNQSFRLRQSPLTYVSASTPSGRASTLELRVNDLLWQEAPSLYGQPGTAPVYTLSHTDTGVTTVVFGDGVEGARLPSGQDNIRARYRKGIGVAGNMAAGKLSNLLSRPQGVNGATNPVPATGGQDAESGDAARENAPRTVLTLDRAVSVQDYEDYARSFAGIAKAHGSWIAAGPGRGVFLSISAEDGAAVPENSDTFINLLSSLRQYGDALLPIRVSSYRKATFKLRASVRVAADADSNLVLKQCETALREAFSFRQRRFGQTVSADEVMAVLHGVAGVEAVNVLSLYRPDQGTTPRLEPRLFARLPEASLTAPPQAAELLLLDEGPITLEQMV